MPVVGDALDRWEMWGRGRRRGTYRRCSVRAVLPRGTSQVWWDAHGSIAF